MPPQPARLRLFVNGREDANSPKSAAGAIDQTGGPLGIASRARLYVFRGVIDEVRWYDHAIGVEGIRASYQQGLDSVEAQRNKVVEPRHVGGPWVELRKPTHDIRRGEKGDGHQI